MHGYLDCLPEERLEALKPIMARLMNKSLVIETDLTNEERQIIAKGTGE